MSAETNKAIVLHLIEEMNAGHPDVLDAHPAMARMKPFFQQMGAAFPDASMAVREALAEGEWVACRMVTRGTQRGDWMGVPATGRDAEWEVIATYRLDDGKIVEQHGQADNISLMRQLGVLPAGVGA